MLFEELLPDEELNETQLKVKYLDPDKGECYLERTTDTTFDIHIRDKDLDGALVELSGGERPEMYLEEVNIDGMEEFWDLGIDLWHPNFVDGIPRPFRRLGFGVKCYYMLLEELSPTILLSGNNNHHSASDKAVRMYQSKNKPFYTKIVENEDGEFIVASLNSDIELANRVLDVYSGKDKKRSMAELTQLLKNYPELDNEEMKKTVEHAPYILLSFKKPNPNKDIWVLETPPRPLQVTTASFDDKISDAAQDLSASETVFSGVNNDYEFDLDEVIVFLPHFNGLKSEMTTDGLFQRLKEIKSKSGYKYKLIDQWTKKGPKGYTNLAFLARPENSAIHDVAEEIFAKFS